MRIDSLAIRCLFGANSPPSSNRESPPRCTSCIFSTSIGVFVATAERDLSSVRPPLILISTRATERKVSESWATSIRVTVLLERTEMDTNDHLFGRAHKSVESCRGGEIGTPHISETAGGYLEKSSPSLFRAAERK